MIIAKVNFPSRITNVEEVKDSYLDELRKTAFGILSLYKKANNLNYRVKKQRLRAIQNNINTNFKINIDIFNLLQFIIKNLTYSKDRKYIILKDELKIKNIPLELIAKYLTYGSVSSQRSSFFKECFTHANNVLTCQIFVTK